MPINPKKSSFKSNTQGQIYGKSYANELKTFINGAGEVTTTFLHQLVDKTFAVIYKDNNGHYRMMFDESIPIELDFEQNTGEGLAAEAGFDVTFKYESKYPPYYLYGDIKVAAGIPDGTSRLEMTTIKIGSLRKSSFSEVLSKFEDDQSVSQYDDNSPV